MKKLTTIICTHNPRPEYLERVLAALVDQREHLWSTECLLIDSGSIPPVQVAGPWRLPQPFRVEREDRPGLTRARLRGIMESSKTDWFLFIDDDNVVAPDYLSAAYEIVSRNSQCACFGGSQTPEFEISPPQESQPFLPALALREIREEQWSDAYDSNLTPYGAGMFLRGDIANRYAADALQDPRRLALDRAPGGIGGGGDTDMAFTACDAGFEFGLSPRLTLTHLIPKKRFELEYLRRLCFGAGYSEIILMSLRFPKRLGWRLFARIAVEHWLKLPFESRLCCPMRAAVRRGRLRALHDLLRCGSIPPGMPWRH